MSASASGYSGTPLRQKLGIVEGMRVAFVNAPLEFASHVQPLPAGVEVMVSVDEPVDLVVFFTLARSELQHHLRELRDAVAPAGAVWVAWPKKSSGVPSSLTEDVVRELALGTGLVDNKVCAIDETWSALRLVVPLADRGP